MKRIRVTDYCLNRISARRLDVNFVEEVIRSPEQIVQDDDDPNRRIYQSRFVDTKGKTKLLRVIVEENKDEIVGITVYPASQFERYWKDEP